MRKFILLTTLAAAAAVVAAGITVQAQTYGPSMMGNDQNYDNRGDCGQGYGMMGNGNNQTNGSNNKTYGQGQGDNQGQNQDQSRGYGPGHMRGSDGGYGPGMMQGNGYGPGMMRDGPDYATGYDRRGNVQGNQRLNLSTDDVKSRVERWLVQQGNQRLKVGDVKENDGDTITADVVTKDNSLVDRFIVNRHTGAIHQDKS